MKLNYLVGMVLAMHWIVGVSMTGIRRPLPCCTKTSNVKVNVGFIFNYTHQDGAPCHFRAVRFLLVNGKTVCSDPEDVWAKHAIKILDGRKAPITSPSSMSTRTHTTTSTSSPGTSTESTTTMTTPKATSTTWKSPTHIPHTPSTKQPLRNTNKPFHWTTKQITTTKMITTTTTPRKPTTTSIETTSMAMTTKIPLITTTPKGPSTTKKPTTHITTSTSSPGTSTGTPKGTSTWKPTPSPTWTSTELTTIKETEITRTTPTTSPTSINNIPLIPEQSQRATNLSQWTLTPSITEGSFNERKKSVSTAPNNTPAQMSTSLSSGNWKESTRPPPPVPETNKGTVSTVNMTDSKLSIIYPKQTSTMPEFSWKIKSQNTKQRGSDENQIQKTTMRSRIAEKEREAQEWTEHFCQWSEIQESRYCTFYTD